MKEWEGMQWVGGGDALEEAQWRRRSGGGAVEEAQWSHMSWFHSSFPNSLPIFLFSAPIVLSYAY